MSRPSPLRELRNFLYPNDYSDCYGVTLTMKQKLDGEVLDEMNSSQNLRHFMNLMNKSMLGNSFKRNGRRIEIIPSLEWSSTGRLHYHLTMKNPNRERKLFFVNRVEVFWNRTRWGDKEMKIVSSVDPGWIDYITKEKSRNQIDWENFYWVS